LDKTGESPSNYPFLGFIKNHNLPSPRFIFPPRSRLFSSWNNTLAIDRRSCRLSNMQHLRGVRLTEGLMVVAEFTDGQYSEA
jgi:hypothetical protein